MIDRQISRAAKGQLLGFMERDCFLHRVLAWKAVDPVTDSTQFMISHDDLAPENIIIDNEYNIKGYVLFRTTRITPKCVY